MSSDSRTSTILSTMIPVWAGVLGITSSISRKVGRPPGFGLMILVIKPNLGSSIWNALIDIASLGDPCWSFMAKLFFRGVPGILGAVKPSRSRSYTSAAQAVSSLSIHTLPLVLECPDPIVGGCLLSGSYSPVVVSEREKQDGIRRSMRGRKVASAAQVIPEASSAIEKHADIHVS